MIKKLKIGLLVVAFALLAVAGTASAATYNANTTIDMSSPDVDLVIVSGSSDDGLVINAGTIVPTISTGETFTLTSASSDLTISPAVVVGDTFTVNKSCSSGTATLIIVGGTSQAFTITPTGTVCSTASSGGGGGGGGGGYVPPAATPATPATPAVPATQIEGCVAGQAFSTTSGKSCTVSATPAVPATPASGSVLTQNSYNFGTTTLKNGSKGEAVKELQRFLNAKLNLGLVVDGKLGPKTIKVIKQWQKDNGLVADGLVGKKTKALMNAMAQ